MTDIMTNKPRKPIFAAAMSAILPGFGQLYNGQLNRALWFFLVYVLVAVPGFAFIALYLPAWTTTPLLAISLLVTLATWITSIIDAWLGARARSTFQPRAWQTSALYFTTLLICNLLILPLVTVYVRGNQVQSHHVPSGSMSPNILTGDYLFTDMRYNCPSCRGAVKRGDIAVFVYPNNRTHHYIKRVVGLPGDEIRIEGEQVFVNDQPLAERESGSGDDMLQLETYGDRQWQVTWKPTDTPINPDVAAADTQMDSAGITIKPGHVFMLGDNRNNSRDSRHFGSVPLSDVVGQARQVWFSWGPDGVRWQRIGKRLLF